MRFPRNLHTIDRGIRLVVGVGCVWLGFMASGEYFANQLVAVLVGLFGIVNVFAFAFNHCPVYHATGLSTYQKDAETDSRT